MSHWFAKTDDGAGFNCSFMTRANMQWFYYVLNYVPDPKKPVVFLPCASAAKTRSRDGKGRKRISDCTSHQLLSKITRNENYERIILSEPLTLIPYSLQGSQPDYNLPVKELSIQSERIFINQLGLWLARLRLRQKLRRYVYYIGATHHYLILKYANKSAGNPFKIIYVVPKHGLRDYAKGAEKMDRYIEQLEYEGIEPQLEPVDVEKWLSSRGRYTNRRFWREIICWQKASEDQVDFDETHTIIGSEIDYSEGFGGFYSQENPIMPARQVQASLF